MSNTPRGAADSVLWQQSSLQEETLRLSTACSDLEADTKERQGELDQLFKILQSVRDAQKGAGGAALQVRG